MIADKPVIVARIARAHGIEGRLLLDAETDYADTLFQPGKRLLVVGGSSPFTVLTVTHAQVHGQRWLMVTEEIKDRTSADKMRGSNLGVLREELPSFGNDGYLLHDLIGMVVVEDEKTIGTILEVYDLPAGPMLGVDIRGRELLIPFEEGIVDRVGIERGMIYVSLPAGLLDI